MVLTGRMGVRDDEPKHCCEEIVLHDNPYESPLSEGEIHSKKHNRAEARSVLLGTVIGFAVGVSWSVIFGPLSAGIAVSALVYITGFTFTGLIVGAVRRFAPLVGATVGLVSLVLWAILVGPADAWFLLWVIVFGGSGVFCGCIIGVIFTILHERAVRRQSLPGTRNGDESNL